MASANPIEQSFELAAERCEDLTQLVYRKLFREHPEAEKMFRSEGSGPVKGSMLALTIEAILDFAGERHGLRRDRGDVAGDPRRGLVSGDRCGVAKAAGRGRGRRSEPGMN